jgi:hypothetical protein
MSNPRAPLPSRLPPPEPRKNSPWLLFSVVGGCAVVSALVIGGLLMFGPSPPPPPPAPERIEPPPLESKAEPATAPAAEEVANNSGADLSPLVDDDGRTLWASPTNGKPLDLAYLPPGCQIIISLRFNDIFRVHRDAMFYSVLDPHLIEKLQELSPSLLGGAPSPDQIPPMTIGLQINSDGEWLVSRVIPMQRPLDELQVKELRTLFEDRVREYQGHWYGVGSNEAYYLTPSANKWVIAPESLIKDIIDLGGNPPPLRRDIERLVPYTDDDRLLTVVFSPASLFALGQQLFTGKLTKLHEPLSWFLGDELSAVAFSANLDSNLFLEFIAVPKLENSTEKVSQILAERVAQISDKVEQYVVNLNAQPYGRLVIARFPEMLRKLAAYTRSGFDRDHATLRCYLPGVAAHNLLLAAELTLAETGGSPAASAVASKAETKPFAASASVKDRLAKVTSLKFARDTLESALDQLSQDIGAPIVIRGPDLQADGITKNQSFGIDLSAKPAGDILVEILRLANPDKTTTGPNDQRQKLVYIIETKPDKTEQIVVTTRTKAAERKDELPAPFRVEKP